MPSNARKAWLACCLLLIGCAPGVLGDATSPQAPSAGAALGETDSCRAVAAYAEPLIVDWKGQQRLDLELAMKGGVAIVSYSCDRFELLKSCNLVGRYTFAGVSRKEDVVQLASRDEVKANLPLSGASLGAALERGTTIDLALVMVGKKATTVDVATRAELEGDCDGATHIVRAATIGAFAMDRGTRGSARAAAELFGAGMSGASDDERREKNKDGQIAACQSSSSADAAPPDQCQAALRLELVPIAEDRQATSDAPEKGPAAASAQKNPCPEGFVLSSNKCTEAMQTESYLCADNDIGDCERQCKGDDMGSCYNLGVLLTKDSANVDKARAAEHFEKACDGDHAQACAQAGDLACKYLSVNKPTAEQLKQCRDPDKTRRLLKKGCDLGATDGLRDAVVASQEAVHRSRTRGRLSRARLQPRQRLFLRRHRRPLPEGQGRGARCGQRHRSTRAIVRGGRHDQLHDAGGGVSRR